MGGRLDVLGPSLTFERHVSQALLILWQNFKHAHYPIYNIFHMPRIKVRASSRNFQTINKLAKILSIIFITLV